MAETERIVITTNFLYREYSPSTGERPNEDTDGIRGDLALQMIDKATGLGVRVVAADGGSSPAFLSALEKRTDQGLIVVTSEIAGRAPQRRRAFEAAITTFPTREALVYIQPEKVSMVDYLTEITKPILDDVADIVVPSRNPEFFRQFYPE